MGCELRRRGVTLEKFSAKEENEKPSEGEKRVPQVKKGTNLTRCKNTED
jgi:hypothetical protein